MPTPQENTIVHKRSAVIGREPTAAQLLFGEFAVNYRDGRVFIKREDEIVLDITQPLYHIDGGLLVVAPPTAAFSITTEAGGVLYTENFKRLIIE
jgi:hypothetical protein